MEPTVLAALIGSIATISSPVIVLFIKNWLEERPLQSIPISRVRAAAGNWRGTAQFKEGEYSRKIDIDCEIKTIRRKCIGRVRGVDPTGKPYYLRLEGIPLDYRYFKLDYKDEDQKVIRHGSIIVMLSSNGSKLSGRYIGYAANLETLIYGKIELTRT